MAQAPTRAWPPRVRKGKERAIIATHFATTMTPSPSPNLLSGLPLFPLGTVLFPGGLLPLKVFEVRYLDMVRRCQREGRPFGVVLLTQGQEVRQAGAASETFVDVGTLATVESLESPQPGLLWVCCRGGERFRIQRRERLPHGLWVADVEILLPDPAVAIPDDLLPLAERLDTLLQSLRQQPGAEEVIQRPTAEQRHDCAWVANRWCELLPLPSRIRQQWLTLDNPLLRLELVGDVLDSAQHGR